MILPCFNEGSRIASSLDVLQSWFGSAADLLVMDDGSHDDTSHQAEQYSTGKPNVRVHRLAQHLGKGAAIRAAIPMLRTDLVVLIDADLVFDRASVERALGGLASADLVLGNRRHPRSRYSVPVRLFGFLYRRHLVSLAFNALVRAVFRVQSRDTQCGLKAFRRQCLDRMAPMLTAQGFALDVEILMVAKTLGLRCMEVPVQVTYDSAQSSVRLLRTAGPMAAEIVRIAFRRAMGRYADGRQEASAAESPSTTGAPAQKETLQ